MLKLKNNRPHPADLAVGLSIVAAVACAFGSISPRMSVVGNPEGPMGLLAITSLGVIYWATRSAFTTYFDRRALISGAVAISTLVSTYALLQVAGLDPLQWTRTLAPFGMLRPFSALGHPNFLAGWLVMLFPFALLTAFETSWGLIPLGLMLPVLFFTQSRGCWVALIIASGVMLWGVIGSKNGRILTIIVGSWVALIAGIFAVLFLGGAELAHTTLDRITHIFVLDAARREYWSAGWRIFIENPWFGCGTDTFKFAFEHARSANYWAIERAGSPNKAHNDLINTLATQGLVGATAWFAVLGAFLIQSRRALRSASPSDRLFTLALIASGVAYYVQNVSGFPSIATGGLFMTVLAMLTPKTFGGFRRWLGPAIVLTFCLGAVGIGHNFIYIPFKASACVSQAQRLEATNPKLALYLYSGSVLMHPEATTFASIGFLAEQLSQWQIAANAFARAHEREPAEAIYLYKLALLTGDKSWLNRAIALEPNNPIFADAAKAL